MNDTSFNAVDVAALVAVLLGVAQGFRRRLSGELARLVSCAAALAAALLLFRPLGDWLSRHTRLEQDAGRTTAFVLSAAAAFGLLLLLRLALKKLMQVAFEPLTDRVGGCVAGGLRATVVALIVFLAMNLWPHEYLNRVFGAESFAGRAVLRMIPFARREIESHEKLKAGLENARRKLEETVSGARPDHGKRR